VPAFHSAARSLEFAQPQRRRLCSVVGLALLLAAASALDPLIMKYLFDQLGRPDGLQTFGLALAGLLALVGAGYLAGAAAFRRIGAELFRRLVVALVVAAGVASAAAGLAGLV
jgi:hypothetical protein